MKTAIFYHGKLFRLLLILTMPLLLSCSNDDGNNDENISDLNLECPPSPKKGPNNDVVGKWKLVKVQKSLYAPETTSPVKDYSCNDIIYDFKKEGVLTISGWKEDLSPSGPANGKHTYQFEKEKLYEYAEKDYTLTLNNISWPCGIDNRVMILDNSPLDGDIQYFIRIE